MFPLTSCNPLHSSHNLRTLNGIFIGTIIAFTCGDLDNDNPLSRTPADLLRRDRHDKQYQQTISVNTELIEGPNLNRKIRAYQGKYNFIIMC